MQTWTQRQANDLMTRRRKYSSSPCLALLALILAAIGAGLVALPENFAYMRREGARYPCAQGPDGEILRALGRWAGELRLWLVGGTLPEVVPGEIGRAHV